MQKDCNRYNRSYVPSRLMIGIELRSVYTQLEKYIKHEYFYILK